jgi:5-methylthioadenosine/S-adenosylhomocysteine deaminase
MTTLVRAEWVLTMGPVGDIRDGAVLIGDDGSIAATGTFADLSATYPTATVVGDEYGVITPGFVNCHNHLSEAFTCGMGEELTLWEWIVECVAPVSPHLTRDLARIGARLKAAEMLLSGVTTVNDMFVHTNHGSNATLGVVDGLDDLGLRGVCSFGAVDSFHDQRPLFDYDAVDAIMSEHGALADRCDASPLSTFRMGVGTVLSQSPRLFEASIAEGKRNGWAVHTHIAEVREELTASRQFFGVNTYERARDVGLLDLQVLAAHCVWCNPYDRSIMKAHGVTVSHNPVANMILASGVCPVPDLRAAGIAVGIGTDGAASNDSNNMLEAIKMAALLQKVHHLDATRLRATDALRMATIEGAHALGLDDRVGSLDLGKRADIVRFTGLRPGLAIVHDPYQQVALCSSPSDVADVWVDGQQRVADTELVDWSLTDLVLDAKPAGIELARKANLQRSAHVATASA